MSVKNHVNTEIGPMRADPADWDLATREDDIVALSWRREIRS
jgi:hypothetical protein